MRKPKTILIAAMLVSAAAIVVVAVVPRARHRGQNVSLGRQWAALLRKHPGFSAKPLPYPIDAVFHYADRGDEDLKKLCAMYDLETVAGRGPEIDRIVNLMTWVFRLTGHANEPEIPKELDAFHLIRLARVEHKQINCYMKTIILNEVYLALGFESRWTHLLPCEKEEEESHFITSVFSRSLDKWILMDPDFGVYVTDERGSILGVAEIRNRLVAGEPLEVKSPAESRLAGAWNGVGNFLDGTNYLWFLSDFIFKIRCPRDSLFAQASKPDRVYFELIPDGYREELLRAPKIAPEGKKTFYLNDEALFWQKPAAKSMLRPPPGRSSKNRAGALEGPECAIASV